MILSVIIPVYRVEATLNRCIDSVLRQRVDAMELILVDDGSPDRCPQMCDTWAERDCRIRVIHKSNGGLSDARNAGLDIAQGDFITFVDSDDWLQENTYAPLLESIGDADIIEYSIAGRKPLADATYTDMDAYWLQGQAYCHAYAWNKIYRRQLFEEARYPEGRVFEDVYILPSLLRKAGKVKTTSHGCYHYYMNPMGITAKADGLDLAQLLDAHLEGGMPMDDNYYMYLVNIQIDVWEQTGNPLRLPYRSVNTALIARRKKLKAYILNHLGIKNLCRISKITHLLMTPSHW